MNSVVVCEIQFHDQGSNPAPALGVWSLSHWTTREVPTPRVSCLRSRPILCPLLCDADLGPCEPHFCFASCFFSDFPVGAAKGKLWDGQRRVGTSLRLCVPRMPHSNDTSPPQQQQAHPEAAAECSLQFFQH